MPSTVAMQAVRKAMRSEIQAASSIAWLPMSETYQRVDQPPQTVTSRDALKE